MENEKTHTRKIITQPNGTLKAVYYRTEETERAMLNRHLDIYAEYEPLDTSLLMIEGKIQKYMIIQCSSNKMANRVIRTRLEIDDRPYHVYTGTELFGDYLRKATNSYSQGFPIYKQFFLKFGYGESGTKNMHQVIAEIMSTRHHINEHAWLMIPESLAVMASRWGPNLLNLEVHPFLKIAGEESERVVAMSNPVAVQAARDERRSKNPSGDSGDPTADPPALSDDPMQDRKDERDGAKWQRRSYD